MPRKRTLIICAYSERISCKTAQIPTVGGAGGRGSGDVPRKSAIFVEAIATSISITKGTAIRRVRRPVSKRTPPTISRRATNTAVA
jgi:hypothetical protein